ncbi:ABC transporter ATP-binding protein/permease [Ruminococcaceae bacterium OttesenSCG-928-A16]|nr:ABC transporter ATP-binding protein/permease [Ruminococcaceae bacterium OttesenSCG-928-A16]
MARSKPKNIKYTLKKFSVYFKNHAFTLTLVGFMAAVSAFTGVLGTYLLKPIINNYILPGNIPGLLRALLLMGGMYLLGVLCTLGYSQLMVRVGQRIIRELRDDLFNHVQTLPLRFFDTHTHGDVMSRFTNDIDTIAEALNNSFTVLIQSFVTVAGSFTLLIVLDYRLSLIVIGSFVLMFLFFRYSGKKSHRYFARQQKHMAGVNSFIEEMVDGQKVVKVFNHEEENLANFTTLNEELRKAGTGALTFSGILIPVSVSISYLNYAITACLGAVFAISGSIDLGTLASYLVFVRQTSMPINQFSQQVNMILAALAGAEHIFEVMDEAPETDSGTVSLVKVRHTADGSYEEAELSNQFAWKTPAPGGAHYTPIKGDVRFEEVTFGYTPTHKVLKNISLHAAPGQKIAFVGSTGAGKTTITNLINRFYEIDGGKITYDGIDIRQMQKSSLRQTLSVVLQDTHLFTGTIADNIRYGNLAADDAMVIEAAKLANADSFIRRLPQGYNTFLTSDGGNLSAGQRQLLAIARAAVADPPVLILDEATSSIDTYTEKMVEIGMDHLMQGRTVFVIAHRLSTVRNANAILVLENGEIIERGNHDELVAAKGRYYQLYTGQFELT